MVADLKRAFKSLVDEANWMDTTTKATAKDKVKHLALQKKDLKIFFLTRWRGAFRPTQCLILLATLTG